MTHPNPDRLLQAAMALTLAGFVIARIRHDDIMAATLLFGYICVAAYWALGRRA